MRIMRKINVAVASFLYCLISASPVMADDTEIYLGGGTSSAGGQPNVLLLIDNSGSMKWKMYTTYPADHLRAGQTVPPTSSGGSVAPTNPDDARGSHLKEAVTRILNVLNGDIRVGVSSYNPSAAGGRIRYPVRRLDDSTSTGPNENRAYRIGASADDANQLTSTGANLKTGLAPLALGNEGLSTSIATAIGSGGSSSPVAYECASNATNSTSYIRVGVESLFLGAAENATNFSNCASAVGLQFSNGDLQLPNDAIIVSAQLILTNNKTTRTDSRHLDNGAFNFTVQLQNHSTIKPPVFGAGSATSNNPPPRVNPRTYFSSSSGVPAPFTVSVAANEMTNGGSKTIDVTNMIQYLVNDGDWDNTGNTRSSLAFRLASTTAYNATSKNARVIDARASGAPPKLIVKWATSSTYNQQNYAGVRFTNVDIPKNATIVSAMLEFTANGDASGPAGSWEVALDPTIKSVPFSTTDHLDSSRWTGGPTPVTYTPTNWTDGSSYGINVTSLVQAQVNKSSYCGGNFAFRIRDTAPIGTASQRFAYNFDDSSAASTQWPRLNVTYTLPAAGNTCIQLSRVVGVAKGSDDGQQVGTAQALQAETVDLKSGTLVGLRFGDLGLPQGATLSSAYLKVKAKASVTTAGTFSIKGAKLADLDTFSDSNKIGSLPLTSASVNWSPAASSWVTDAKMTSPDIKAVIQEIVDQSTWDKGHGLALVLQGSLTGTTFPKFYQVDNGASGAPTLEINYTSSNPDDAKRTVRTDLLDLIKTYDFNTSTPLNESYYESALYMLGRNAEYGKADLFPESAPSQTAAYKYITPIDGGQCQSNNIIMLTDGEPTNDLDTKTVSSSSCTTVADADGSGSNSWDCMIKTATYLNDVGLPVPSTPDPTDKSVIKTYTIGFGPDVANTQLPQVASKGGGDYFAATNVDTLVSSFQAIFERIADTNGTMASPGVAVNQLNRSEHLDQLYYGVFKPAATKRWVGNVKRYRLGEVDGVLTVVDATGDPAIDPATKFFSTNSKSYWSDSVDGNNADAGGAAGEQTSARTVYMDSGSPGAMTTLNPLSPPAGMDAATVNWVRGLDSDDDDADGDTSEPRKNMGAPIHAQPAMVPYGTGAEDFVVFTATNDGLLHSINTSDGSENWTWLPSDMVSNLSLLRANAPISAGGMPKYGLDGNWTYMTVGTTRLLVGGMRQGGSNVYALELGDTRTAAPRLKWVLKPTTTGFSRLGATWSQPVPTKVRVGGVIKDVLVFGAGLDYGLYESNGPSQVASGNELGNAVYMVDALTGDLVWSASNTGTTSSSYNKVTALKYSVPGSVRPVDKGSDRLADHLYFADTGGQIFRVDIDNSSNASKLVKRVALLAQLGAAEQTTPTKPDDRRFYETPTVEYMTDSSGKLYAAVALGSGNRNFPRSDRTARDRFFMVRDYDAARFDILRSDQMDEAGDGTAPVADLATFSAPLRTTNLADLTSLTGTAADAALVGKSGWYITLGGTGRDGEKVLSTAFIFSRFDPVSNTKTPVVGFNTFLPDSVTADGCSLVSGSTTVYTLKVNNADALLDINGSNSVTIDDRRVDGVSNGITGSDVVLVRDGQLVRVSGTRASVEGDLPALSNRMLRTRWYDKR